MDISRTAWINPWRGASLKDDELMHEVDNENPNKMYNQAQKLLRKYYGSSSISN